MAAAALNLGSRPSKRLRGHQEGAPASSVVGWIRREVNTGIVPVQGPVPAFVTSNWLEVLSHDWPF